MNTTGLRILEITDINDDLLLPWLDLYEVSFPPEEKVLVSMHLNAIKKKANGQATDIHFLACVDPSGRLAACICYDINREHAVLHVQYLAVLQEMQCMGIGSICYDEICKRAREEGLSSIILELEIPEHAKSTNESSLAMRRICFYRRHGAYLLKGIDYIQNVGSHQPPMPMHIMVHPFCPMDANDAFHLAKGIFGNAISQTGSLTLE